MFAHHSPVLAGVLPWCVCVGVVPCCVSVGVLPSCVCVGTVPCCVCVSTIPCCVCVALYKCTCDCLCLQGLEEELERERQRHGQTQASLDSVLRAKDEQVADLKEANGKLQAEISRQDKQLRESTSFRSVRVSNAQVC